MQNFLNQYLTPRNEKVVIISFIIVLEIVLMAFFATVNNAWNTLEQNTFYSKYGSGWALQLVNAIFFFLAYILLAGMQFYNTFQLLSWVLIGNTSFMALGLLLGLIGMGITSQLFIDSSLEVQTYLFNYPVAFWFVQLMVFIVALVFEYRLHKNAQQGGEVFIKPMNQPAIQPSNQHVSQPSSIPINMPPPIQYYVQPNPTYVPQNVTWRPIQQSSFPAS